MHVHFTQIKERVAAAPGYLLLAKAVSRAVSVVKGGLCSRRSCYKPCTKVDKCLLAKNYRKYVYDILVQKWLLK